MKIGMELPFTLDNKRINTYLKFDFWKVPFWTLEKVHFWFLKKTPQKIVFFMFRLWFSFKNNRRTNGLLVGIFENAKKNLINCQKRPKWRFWRSITFFCAFSKILTKRTFVHLLFLKLNQSQNTKNRNNLGFSSKT